MKAASAGLVAIDPSWIAWPMRGSSCITTRPAPMLRCPTSELPICPGGSPTSRPEVRRNACGPSISASNTGVSASCTALPAVSSRQPQPSKITSMTGLGWAVIGIPYACE